MRPFYVSPIPPANHRVLALGAGSYQATIAKAVASRMVRRIFCAHYATECLGNARYVVAAALGWVANDLSDRNGIRSIVALGYATIIVVAVTVYMVICIYAPVARRCAIAAGLARRPIGRSTRVSASYCSSRRYPASSIRGISLAAKLLSSRRSTSLRLENRSVGLRRRAI